MANLKQNPKKTVRGALPCGNPDRYTSADVVRMQKDDREPGQSRMLDLGDQTECDQYFKTLLKHQSHTDITLKEQFSQHRSFVESSSLTPTIDMLEGLHSSYDHAELNILDSRIDYLKSCGLSAKEIIYQLKKESLIKTTTDTNQGLKADPATEDFIVEEIERKISEKEELLRKSDKFTGGLELSRQALDLERSILERQNKESSIPKCLFRQKTIDAGDPDDPINHIPDILSHIEPKPVREPRRERRRKRKLNQKLLKQQKYLGTEANPDVRQNFLKSVGLETESHDADHKEICVVSEGVSCDTVSSNPKDVDCPHRSDPIQTEDRQSQTASPAQDCQSDATKAKKKKKSVKSADSFLLKDFIQNVQLLSREEIQGNRLSKNEIFNINKFQHYEEGNPNKVVFVKNLPKDVTENDIVSLFAQFQQRQDLEISFRLLSGRMKGQAFVTFPDTAMAKEAISAVNGFMLREKPVILSYGKKQEH